MEDIQNLISVRQSVSGNEPELKRIWQTVFGDSAEFIEDFFKILYSPGDACLALIRGELISAGYCLPGVTALGKKCSYIYAMATYPEHRSCGAASLVARSLVKNAFAGGADIVATLPATESLEGFYEKVLGMAPTFVKGLPGAKFPESWRRFDSIYSGCNAETPDRLWAVGAPGVNIQDLKGFGWELVFD